MARHSVTGLCWLPLGSRSVYRQVPLQNVRVDASVYDLCAEVKVQQTYINDLHTQSDPLSSHTFPSSSLECVYIFPLDEESAVFSFVAELDGMVVEGCIREKMVARVEYNAAVARHRTAMLLEQYSDNIFQIKVGNLKPGSVCTVTLTYLTLLEQQGRHNRLTLPMIIAPKYTPGEHSPTPLYGPPLVPAPNNTIHKGYHCHHCLCSPIIGTRHHCETCTYDLCHGCHMQHDISHDIHVFTGPVSDGASALPSAPPLHTTVESKLRDLTIKLAITMPSPIISIECPSHPSETKITHHKDLSSHAATAFFHSMTSCSLSKDFILLIEQQRCFDPRVLCELDMVNNTAAVSLAFIPQPVDMLSASQIQCELIFLIDCSGSMMGSSIRCVRECMQLLLRSLPVHSRFNIITFGSQWHSLFQNSQAYDDTSLSEASQFISGLEANLGGTEIYPPLLHILSGNILPAHPRQVFLLTDGQVSNIEQLARLTTQHAASTRLFTFGIGGAVDRLLCKKLAQAGHGKCEFVTAEDGGGAGMREKVVRQIARAMQPVLTDVKVDWRQLKGTFHGASEASGPPLSVPSASFLQCPSIAPAIFMSSRYILHALNVSLPDYVWQQAKEGKEVEFQCEITISAQSNHPQETGLMHHSVVLMGDQITQAHVIHTLAAKERIRELENQMPTCFGEAKKGQEDEILHLGLRHTLCSSRTSFVAVYNAGTDKQTFEETDPVGNTVEEVSYGCCLFSSAPGLSRSPPTQSFVKSFKFGAPPGSACNKSFFLAHSCASPEYSPLSPPYFPTSPGYTPTPPLPFVPTSPGYPQPVLAHDRSSLGYAPCSPSQPAPQGFSFGTTAQSSFSSIRLSDSNHVAEGRQSSSPMFGGASAQVTHFPGWNAPSKMECETFSSVNSLFGASFASLPFAKEQQTSLDLFGQMQPEAASVDEEAFTGSLQSAPCAIENTRQSPAHFTAPFGNIPWKDAGANAFDGLIQLQPAKGMWQLASVDDEAFTGSLQSAPCTIESTLQSPAHFTAPFGNIPWKDAGADAFDDLIQLQSAKGVWQLTPMLIKVVHAIKPPSVATVTVQSLQALSREQGVDNVVVGVIVALQLLETHFKHREAEWEMLAMKALFFLKEDAKISAKVQQDIKESITKLLGN